ncbi:MAG: penicillin-binding protein 1C [Gemmatimonadota bacterium]|nr:penicillin-binding protein 1C [Gemmatimonadota bacterium]
MRIARYALYLLAASTLGAALYFLTPLPRPLFAPDYSTLIVDHDGQLLRAFLSHGQQWCFPPDTSLAVPAKLRTAVLHFEDRRFYRHLGVDPLALGRALYQSATAGTVKSGASTITMQVARLMRPKERTYVNKTLETLLALKIELYYAKDQILRLYLDHAPYGGNIVGYQAAAHKYFRKPPDELTWSEAATLAVLPNAPGLVSPTADPQRLVQKRNRLLADLQNSGYFDAETLRLALAEPVPTRAFPYPVWAPHLSRSLKRDRQGRLIKTTIDANLQRELESLVGRHLRYLDHQGIGNGAALLVETGSGKVRAYVGSRDFFDPVHQGQVDGVIAPRSSGSLLKPFLYALSMDAGLILPQTLVKDVPTFYSGFSPRNADERYDGLVRAEEALVRSLNVPAVRLLRRYGLFNFYRFLQDAGVSTLVRPADDYGLPLILGGAEVTLWDMARLFRGLARGGQIEPLRYLQEQTELAPSVPLISPSAAYLVLEALRNVRRPGVEYYWHQYQDQWPLAWKTGTSYGQRDAWALGVSPAWTIAVWVGNFSGEGNPALSGARAAGPLLFDIFHRVPKDLDQAWFPRPDADLTTATLCLDSGQPASPHCPQPTQALTPRHRRPMPRCPYHRSIVLNGAGTHQVCSLCWKPDDHRLAQQMVYPTDVVQYLRERGQVLHDPPPHKADCPVQPEAKPLQVLYPTPEARLQVGRDFDGKQQPIVLRAAHSDRERALFWYVNHRFLGRTVNQHRLAVSLEPGAHALEIVDAHGFRDRTRFYVVR